MVGQTVLHFEILDELGRGGMGVVYRARDTHLKRDVALKFLPPTEDRRSLRPLISEAIAASRLEKAPVVTIYADYESPQGSFLCMECVSGGSLKDRLDEGPLPLDAALRIGASVAEALEAAHGAAILHCDLKPGNVLLPADGTPAAKVTDFGLSRSVFEAVSGRSGKRDRKVDWSATTETASIFTGSSRTGLGVAGTPGYMSPEQWRGGPLDVRSDLYALGVILFEMGTGRNPALGRGHRGSGSGRGYSASAGRRHRPEFPPAYWRLVERLTAPDPKKRPRNAAAVRRSLARLLASVERRAGGEARDAVPRLFGREAECAELGHAVTDLIDGRGGGWLIEGTQGVGKTALIEHVRAHAVGNGAVVLVGSCLRRDAALPYRPLLEAIEGFIVEHGAGAGPARVLEDVVGLSPELATFLTEILLAPAGERPQLAGRAQLRDALRSVVQALARDGSLVLALEDLHLADSATAELFASWAHAAPEMPLLLLGTCDPENHGKMRDWILARGAVRALALAPLDRQATERLLRSLLPVLPADHRGFDQVYWRTGGLPGFVIEIARLAGRAGASLAEVERVLEGVMPESIRASLALRVDRLDPDDLKLLRAAAVVGERFAPSLLESAGFADRRDVYARLDALEREHHLVRRRAEDRYMFDNPQVREFLLSTLHPDARREMHGRFADLLRDRGADIPPEVMARHLLGAGRVASAGRYLRAAAESALSVFADAQALQLADLAEKSLPRRGGDTQRRDVHLIRARALESLGRYDDALSQAEQAVRLADRARSRAVRGEARVILGSIQRSVGKIDLAERTLRRAETLCRDARKPRSLARALMNRGHIRYQRGRLAGAVGLYQDALDAARRGRDPVLVARARANLSNIRTLQGDLERAAAGYRETLEFHRSCGDRINAANDEGNLALIRLSQGRLDEARELLNASLHTREELADRRGVAAMQLRLALLELTLGRGKLAAERAGKAKRIANLAGAAWLASQAGLIEAECLLDRRAYARAEKHLRALLEQSGPLGESTIVNVSEALVRAQLARGAVDDAVEVARGAQRVVRKLRHPSDERRAIRMAARVQLARGRCREAIRLLDDEYGDALPDEVEEQLELLLLRAAAAAALPRRAVEAAAGRERAASIVAGLAQELASPEDRKSFRARRRRIASEIDKLGARKSG